MNQYREQKDQKYKKLASSKDSIINQPYINKNKQLKQHGSNTPNEDPMIVMNGLFFFHHQLCMGVMSSIKK